MERFSFKAAISICGESEDEARRRLQEGVARDAAWEEPKIVLVNGAHAEAEPLEDGERPGRILSTLDRAAYDLLRERVEQDDEFVEPATFLETLRLHEWLVEEAESLGGLFRMHAGHFELPPTPKGGE